MQVVLEASKGLSCLEEVEETLQWVNSLQTVEVPALLTLDSVDRIVSELTNTFRTKSTRLAGCSFFFGGGQNLVDLHLGLLAYPKKVEEKQPTQGTEGQWQWPKAKARAETRRSVSFLPRVLLQGADQATLKMWFGLAARGVDPRFL